MNKAKPIRNYISLILISLSAILSMTACQPSKTRTLNSSQNNVQAGLQNTNYQDLISAGGDSTCVLLGGGGVQCWGNNGSGQLGNGTTSNSQIPVSVQGLSGAISVSVGDSHACALMYDSTIKCWGSNWAGQLGNGTINDSKVPVSVSGISTAIAVSAGKDGHTCALLRSGQVQCWGDNSGGKLGIPTSTRYLSTPITISGLDSVTSISAGYDHNCAILSNGSIKCWGANGRGNLGNGSQNDSTYPVDVIGISNAKAVSANDYFTCALLADGTVQCWGYGGDGELGNGAANDSTTPVPVSGLADAISISAGDCHVCASLSNGTAKCWGANWNGQLGNNDTAGNSVNSPVDVFGLNGINTVVSGYNHTCSYSAGGNMSCWGDDTRGQLGNGQNQQSFIPVAVTNVLVPLSGLSYPVNQTGYGLGDYVSLYPTYQGATITQCAIASGNTLPIGLTLNTSNCAIYGTVSKTNIVGPYNYTISASNGISVVQTLLSINVVDQYPSSLSYPNTAGTVTWAQGQTITSLSPKLLYGTNVKYALSYGALPLGLALDPVTGVISGTVSMNATVGSNSITVKAYNATGSTLCNVSFKITIAPPNVSYQSAILTQGQTGVSIVPTLSGGAPAQCAISPTPPLGLSIANNCTISGNLSMTAAAGTFAYTITASNNGGTFNTALAITIGVAAPVISYVGSPYTFTHAVAITPISVVNAGGTIASCAISPALPTGLVFDPVNCGISGTAAAAHVATPYTITATNVKGTSTATINITVK